VADIWDNLNTTKLGDDPGQIINTQTRNIHLEKENKQLLSDVNLINQASFRTDSAAIPGTLVIRQVVSDDSGTKFAMDWINPGEVWQVYGFCISAMNGRSGSCNHEVFILDKVNSLRVEIIDVSASSSQLPLHENNWMGPVWMDENSRIDYECTGTFTDSTMQFVSIRVR